MVDEMTNVQNQQKGVNPLWPIGTAVVGMLGTAYGVNKYNTSPYKSVEDLIAEKEDTFNGKLQNATDQQKSLMEKAKAIREQAAKAAEEYTAKAEAYTTANKYTVEETPAFKELVQKQTEMTEKVKGLEAAAGEAATTSKPIIKKPIAAINYNANQLYRASEQLRTLKEAGASKEAIAAVQANVDKYNERLSSAINKIVEATKFEGTSAEVAAAKDELKLMLERQAGIYQQEREVFNAKRPINAVISARTAITEQQKAIEEALKTIKETTAHGDFKGYDLSPLLENSGRFDNRINKLLEIENNKTTVLEKLLNDYAATPAGKKPGVWTRIAVALEYIASGKPMPNTPENVALTEFINNIKDSKHKEAVEKLLSGKEITKEEVEQLLAESKERARTLTEATANIRASQATIALSKQNIADKEAEIMLQHKDEILREVKGSKFKGGKFYITRKGVSKKGTTPKYVSVELKLKDTPFSINEAGEVCKNGKVIEKPAEFKAPEFKPAEALTAQRDRAVKSLKDRIAKLDPTKDAGEIRRLNEEIAKVQSTFDKKINVAKSLDTLMPKEVNLGTIEVPTEETRELNNARKQLEALNEQVRTAREALPKGTEKTSEQLANEVAEKYGTKEDYIKKAVEKSEKDIKALFEKKWGSGKLAAAIAGGTVLAGLIGYAIAPKHRNDA